MSTSQLYHYVYRITNIVERKHYYGKRSSKILPVQDLGIRYFSSSTDISFIEDQKENPQNYKYKIVSIHSDAVSAISKEIKLHNKFNVNKNNSFYNRAKQTMDKFDRTGQKHSEQSIEKMKLAQKGRTITEATKEKLREANLGKIISEETKLKMSLSHLGKKFSEEACKNMSKARSGANHHYYGKTLSEETKRKMSAARSGVKNANSKLANVYDKYTNQIVAENVVLSEWCKSNPKYDVSNLSMTTRADRSKPSSATNRHYHKGLYAKYI